MARQTPKKLRWHQTRVVDVKLRPITQWETISLDENTPFFCIRAITKPLKWNKRPGEQRVSLSLTYTRHWPEPAITLDRRTVFIGELKKAVSELKAKAQKHRRRRS